MTTFTWTVNQMLTVNTPEPDFVCTVLWTLTGVDGQYTAFSNGTSTFTSQSSSFIPYSQLTQDQVIGWVQSQLGEDGVQNCEAYVQGQIDSMITPPVTPQDQPLPWSA